MSTDNKPPPPSIDDMTLLDYAAIEALKAVVDWEGGNHDRHDELASIAYDYAEAMMEERAKRMGRK